MFGGEVGKHSAAGGAGEEADLHEIRLIDVLNRIFFLGNSRGDRLETYRSAVEVFMYESKYFAVRGVKAQLVYAKKRKGLCRRFVGDPPVGGLHLGIITDTFEQTIGNARCETGGGGNFVYSVFV